MRLPQFSTLQKKFRGLLVRRIVGDSMLPIFKPGHVVLAVPGADALQVGNVVIIKHGGLEKIKRITQIKGDRVFVVGDNQTSSTDSRTFGWLHTSTVQGKVMWPRPMAWQDWAHVAERALGVAGTLTCLYLFFPTWPSPDKLIGFLFFVFMIFGQARQMLLRLGPFVVIILAYESFRGIIPSLNAHVHYTFMPQVDNALFGGTLPTTTLQHWLWHGHVSWYDIVLYGVYMLHFVIPLGLAILVWKLRPKQYWRVISVYVLVSFAGFLTYLLYPAAPPWMASDQHIIPHITYVSGQVLGTIGLHDAPTVYGHIGPNPVAAVPSLHAAYATIFTIIVWMLFGKKWGTLSLVYPFLIFTGTVYLGEHYAFDELLGIVYGVLGVLIVYVFSALVWPGHAKTFPKSSPR